MALQDPGCGLRLKKSASHHHRRFSLLLASQSVLSMISDKRLRSHDQTDHQRSPWRPTPCSDGSDMKCFRSWWAVSLPFHQADNKAALTSKAPEFSESLLKFLLHSCTALGGGGRSVAEAELLRRPLVALPRHTHPLLTHKPPINVGVFLFGGGLEAQ